MQKDLSDPYVFILRADSFHNSEQFDKAVFEYTKAMGIDGSLSDAYVGRDMALTAQDSLEAASQDFTRALELDPAQAAPATAGKMAAARYFFHYELPKNGAWLNVVESRDPTCTALPEEAF